MISAIPEYIVAVIFTGISLLIAALVSNNIKFDGGADPKDPLKRKLWFWVIGTIGASLYLLFGLFDFYFPLNNSFAKAKTINALGIATAVCFVLYIVIGFILSASIRNGKINNWFHGKK